MKGENILVVAFPLSIASLLLHTFLSCIASSNCLNSSVALKICCSAFSISSCNSDNRVCAANLKPHRHTRKILNSQIYTRYFSSQ